MAITAPKPKFIRFIKNHCPALTAGEYKLTATHSMIAGEQGGTSDGTQATYTFSVRGPRFSLTPGSIRKVFPPDGAQGEFAGSLPHVLFARDTLPWERELSPGLDKTTWLAVLVFDADDSPMPVIQTGAVSDLQTTSTVVGYSADIKGWLEKGQSATTRCRYIDVPAALFNALAPSTSDLKWLAHVRHVVYDDGSIAELATVMANRFPKPGTKSTAVLVSLEGMGNYLPGSDASPAPSGSQCPVPPGSSVRLIVLHHWSFTAITERVTFSTLVRGLNQGGRDDSLLRLPTAFLPDSSLAKPPLDSGYAALSHRLRTGCSTISWYRGPLASAPVSVPGDVTLPVQDADEITFFDNVTGMFNVSYAAAWQIGRLLALSDQNFTTTLYNWKRLCRSLACQKLQDSTPAARQRGDYAKARAAMLDDTSGKTLKAMLGPLATPATPADEPTDPEAFFLPAAVTTWLAGLALFHRVPFYYLVPDERMFPAESLRFFTVDAFWRRALLDGAFSIGRGMWPAFDQVFAEDVYAAAEAEAGIGDGPMTGVLLRSGLVSGWWPGLVFDGFDVSDPADGAAPLNHLRLECLAPDVVICLFGGTVECLKIHEPSEGLHFGMSVLAYDGGAVTLWQKDLRDLTTTDASYGREQGSPLFWDASTMPFRYGLPGVLRVDDLANLIKGKYSDTIQSSFTAAEFALSMIEGAEGGTFKSKQ